MCAGIQRMQISSKKSNAKLVRNSRARASRTNAPGGASGRASVMQSDPAGGVAGGTAPQYSSRSIYGPAALAGLARDGADSRPAVRPPPGWGSGGRRQDDARSAVA